MLKQLKKRILSALYSKIKADFSSNQIVLPKGGTIHLTIIGKNNKVLFPKDMRLPTDLDIKIFGNNNTIEIAKTAYLRSFKIKIGEKGVPCNHSTFYMGENSGANGLDVLLFDDYSKIEIGNECMLSFNVEMRCSDVHSVINSEGQAFNRGRFIKIGNHVWIGKDVAIGKNVIISDNSIVGWHSVVCSKFEESGVVIAGNPATIKKRGVTWRKESIDDLSPLTE